MSELKVNKISPRSGTDVTLGDSGDTFTVPTGVTLDTSNSTVTLPDSSVSLAKLTATGTKDATTFLRGDNTFAEAGGGIEMVQQWRLTSNFTGYQSPIASNWEIVDTNGYGGIGSSMTESSGVFTFPSTGIYQIDFRSYFYLASGDTRIIEHQIFSTTDNSSYSQASSSATFIQNTNGATTYSEAQCSHIFDVTNTSTHKVRFAGGDGSVNTVGDTNITRTSIIFTRLGDT